MISARWLKYIAALVTPLILVSRAEAFCFNEAGQEYGVSPELLWNIAKHESKFNPTAINWNRNKSGKITSYDFGLMQINSRWKKELGPIWEQLGDPCTNVRVGAWILSQCIRDYGNTWRAVGCYNSRTPSINREYASKIAESFLKNRNNLLSIPPANANTLFAKADLKNKEAVSQNQQIETTWESLTGNGAYSIGE